MPSNEQNVVLNNTLVNNGANDCVHWQGLSNPQRMITQLGDSMVNLSSLFAFRLLNHTRYENLRHTHRMLPARHQRTNKLEILCKKTQCCSTGKLQQIFTYPHPKYIKPNHLWMTLLWPDDCHCLFCTALHCAIGAANRQLPKHRNNAFSRTVTVQRQM